MCKCAGACLWPRLWYVTDVVVRRGPGVESCFFWHAHVRIQNYFFRIILKHPSRQDAGGFIKKHSLTVGISHWWCCFPGGLTVAFVDSFWSYLITNRQVGNMWKKTNREKTLPRQNTSDTSVIAVSVLCLYIGNIIYCRWFNIETNLREVNSQFALEGDSEELFSLVWLYKTLLFSVYVEHQFNHLFTAIRKEGAI